MGMSLDGKKVWVCGSGFSAGRLAAALQVLGGEVTSVFGDRAALEAGAEPAAMADLDGYAQLVDRQVRAGGSPQVVVNAFLTQKAPMKLHEYPAAELDRAYLELDAYSYLTKAVSGMPGGVIVNLVSALGLVPAARQPLASAVSAAVIRMTQAWALEMAELNIRVAAVAVGMQGPADPEALSYLAEKRAVEPAEVAAAVAYLASDEAAYTAGACLPLDGCYSGGYCRNF